MVWRTAPTQIQPNVSRSPSMNPTSVSAASPDSHNSTMLQTGAGSSVGGPKNVLPKFSRARASTSTWTSNPTMEEIVAARSGPSRSSSDAESAITFRAVGSPLSAETADVVWASVMFSPSRDSLDNRKSPNRHHDLESTELCNHLVGEPDQSVGGALRRGPDDASVARVDAERGHQYPVHAELAESLDCRNVWLAQRRHFDLRHIPSSGVGSAPHHIQKLGVSVGDGGGRRVVAVAHPSGPLGRSLAAAEHDRDPASLHRLGKHEGTVERDGHAVNGLDV